MRKTEKNYIPAKAGFSFGRLETFLLVFDAGTIGNAARKAGKKQSLFSKQIGELEAHFKTKLGVRTPHGFKPTANGRRLAELTRPFFAGLRGFGKGGTPQLKRLRIGAGDSVIRWILVPALSRLLAKYPQCEFVFHDAHAWDLLKKVSEGTLDFAIVQHSAIPKAMEAKPLTEFAYALFGQRKDAAKIMQDMARGEATVFRNYCWAVLEEDSRVGRAMRGWFAELGVIPRIKVICRSNLMLAETLVFSQFFPGSRRAFFPTEM
jgi:DNA-binding transcriptional LysR family regulator